MGSKDLWKIGAPQDWTYEKAAAVFISHFCVRLCNYNTHQLTVNLLDASFCNSMLICSSTMNSTNLLSLQIFKIGGSKKKMLRVCSNQKCSALQAPTPKFLNFWKVLPPKQEFLAGKIMSQERNLDSSFMFQKRPGKLNCLLSFQSKNN